MLAAENTSEVTPSTIPTGAPIPVASATAAAPENKVDAFALGGDESADVDEPIDQAVDDTTRTLTACRGRTKVSTILIKGSETSTSICFFSSKLNG